MRKCRNCLCRNCIHTCCSRKKCQGKKKACERYSGFQQLSIFTIQPKPQYNKAPRHSWDHYGISKERYKELTAAIRSGRYDIIARQAAYAANKDIAEYILLSVMEEKSWDKLEYVESLGRMPCGRTDFYGYRRLFYHLFEEKVKENDNSRRYRDE